MLRVNFHLTDKQIDTLRKLSKKTGLTVAELVRRAVDAFLKKSLLIPLIPFLLVAYGCSTHVQSLRYQPAVASPMVAAVDLQPVKIGHFADNRRTDAHWLGAIRGGYGNVLKKLTTDKPMSEVVQVAFVEALAARKIVDAPSSRVVIEGIVFKFDCSYYFNREAHAHLQVDVFSLPVRKLLFSRLYKTDNTESGVGAGIFGDPDHLARFAQTTLNQTIDKVIADPAFLAALKTLAE